MSHQDSADIAMNPIYDSATEPNPKSNTNTSVTNPNYDMTIATQARIASNNSSVSPTEATDNPLYESSTDTVAKGGNPIYESYADQEQNPLYESGPEPLSAPTAYPGEMNPIYSDGLPEDYCDGGSVDTGVNPVYEAGFNSKAIDDGADSRFNPIYEMGDVSGTPANRIQATYPIYSDAGDPEYDNVTTGNVLDMNPLYEATSDVQSDSSEPRKPRAFSLNRSEAAYSKLDADPSVADDETSGLRKRADSKPKGSERHPDEVPFTEDAYDNEGLDVMNELYGNIDINHEKAT